MTSTGYGSAAATDLMPPPLPAKKGAKAGRPSGKTRLVVLAIAAVYFIGPLVAAFVFTIRNSNTGHISLSAYAQIFQRQPGGLIGIGTALTTSIELAVLSILITLALMLPTMLLLHLRYRKVRPVVEVITLLPLVFPPVVLVVGVQYVFVFTGNHFSGPAAAFMRGIRGQDLPVVLALLYVTLAMPFVYRALDAGIRSIDVTTLVEASRNLGASWFVTLWRVLMPSLRTSIINASFLCFALVMGEYTIAKILLFTRPFPVWLAQLPTTSGQVQSATSLLALIVVEILLLLIGALNWRSRTERKA
jgi:putative spermidine/putrescine transport system permease protein